MDGKDQILKMIRSYPKKAHTLIKKTLKCRTARKRSKRRPKLKWKGQVYEDMRKHHGLEKKSKRQERMEENTQQIDRKKGKHIIISNERTKKTRKMN